MYYPEPQLYAIKYFDNEIKLVPGQGCLQPENCNKYCTKCEINASLAKQKFIKYYADKVAELCKMTKEEFIKEHLIETRELHTTKSA